MSEYWKSAFYSTLKNESKFDEVLWDWDFHSSIEEYSPLDMTVYQWQFATDVSELAAPILGAVEEEYVVGKIGCII